MAFSVPDFNLLCDVYTGPWVGKVLRIVGLPCNLAFGRRVQTNYVTGFDGGGVAAVSNLLVPARSDVRDYSCVSGYDVFEVPSGTGRFYYSSAVDDVGRGFPNEYRIVILAKVAFNVNNAEYPGGFWPTPIP
jgi:hypothetical protein